MSMARVYRLLDESLRWIDAQTFVEKHLARLHIAFGAMSVQFIEGVISYPSRGAEREQDLEMIEHLRAGGRSVAGLGSDTMGATAQSVAQNRDVMPALGMSAAIRTAQAERGGRGTTQVTSGLSGRSGSGHT